MEKHLSQLFTQERLKLVLECAHIGLWDWNLQTGVVSADGKCAATLGLCQEGEVLSFNEWKDLIHPDDVDQCLSGLNAHLEGKAEFFENLHRMRHSDGRWLYVLDRGRVSEWDAENRPVHFIGTHADVTVHKEAEIKVARQHRNRERFFSAISHELRAPVHAMLGIVDLVEQQLKNAKLSEQLSIVQDSGKHLLLIIKDLLDTAKFEDSNIELHPSVFDPVELVCYVINLYSVRARQKGLLIKSEIKLMSSSVLLEMDRTRLIQVLINLVSNAIKYTETGEVIVQLTETDTHIVYRVIDTGVGIRDVVRVFEAYQQEQSTRFDDVNSTGLGLYICRAIAREMKLDINVSSELGNGSTFEVLVPRTYQCEPDAREAYVATEHEADPLVWPEKTLLIVDDTPVNIMLLKGMLKHTPLNIIVARNGEDALHCLGTTTVDVVVTDVHMPKMGGLRLTDCIRKDANIKQPIIIGQSADAVEEVRDRCLQVGMSYYLPKPYSQNQLLSLLDDFIMSGKALQSE